MKTEKEHDKTAAASEPSTAATTSAITPEEVERLVDEAYLRGKNEAIEAKILADSQTVLHDMDDSDTDLASLFSIRKSVWE